MRDADEYHLRQRLQHRRHVTGGYFGGCYDADGRWVDILSAETG